MSEPLKGGFSSFTSGTPFKLPGTTGTNTQSTGLFGNTAQAGGSGINASNPGAGTTPNLFGGGSTGNLFGNNGAKPATSSLFGGGTAGTGSTSIPATGGGGNAFGGFGVSGTSSSPAPNNSATPATSATSAFGGALFGAKPAEQSTNPAPGMSTTPKPTGNLFGFGNAGGNTAGGNTTAQQPPNATTPSASSLFGKPAETNASASAPASGAPAGGSPFGANLFGKKPDAPAASSTPSGSTAATAPSAFGAFGVKKDENADKDKEKNSTAAPAAPSPLFGQPAAGKDAPAGTSTPAFSMFGQKPAEKKDGPPEEEKKDGTATPAFSSLNAATQEKPSTPIPTGISVPPPSMLRGKTIEEIVNKWSTDLESHVREFNRLAGEVAVWDRALIDNGNTIAALFQHVLMAEREQSDIEQSLKLVEDQQKELASTLEVYEKSAGEIFEGQGGGLRALDVGPADAERDKHYTLAADLNANLDDLMRSLTQMIESVNALSESPEDAAGSDGGKSKPDAPLEQIAQILSSHLESLQWIDSAVREVDSKVSDVERLVRDASGSGSRNSSTTNSLSGSVRGTSGLRGSRGFGLR